jgi:glycine cleavage system H protein
MKIEKYDLPDEMYYHDEHTFAKKEGDIIIVGLSDFAQQLAGEIVMVELSSEGDEVEQSDPFGTVSSGKWTGPVFAPVGGEIVEANNELEDNPTLINEDPYGKGWMIKIRPSDTGELENLHKGGTPQFAEWFQKEMAEKAPE